MRKLSYTQGIVSPGFRGDESGVCGSYFRAGSGRRIDGGQCLVAAGTDAGFVVERDAGLPARHVRKTPTSDGGFRECIRGRSGLFGALPRQPAGW